MGNVKRDVPDKNHVFRFDFFFVSHDSIGLNTLFLKNTLLHNFFPAF